ncbi:MAG TPA: hypothetical protein ENG09_04200 [Candidatus Syntrophoarchaeum butanivorans]|uniref:THIF-type NAD/FAD binding fold domain-containing protein n=1 Tax=Candidatus Syntropharchaeum butanivorans TaxID=1839936 RepID=A0A1F2P531_9EURY|nr:MAG: hypothetical protein SBU_001029 [Candidatus Syntrophoarchaeum butanivorans]RJS70626.1 MAG: hypothetical protein CW694_07070 [Candidatus Syntrophoarchaeum sp. WYZ-LMO15]HDM36437.1 hypothetical protein [Candidatus Syntrophoarchaeum butanivorans]HEC57313.1 hypothetical protein [Candidatus Syntrophoarchaeum butanivorans]
MYEKEFISSLTPKQLHYLKNARVGVVGGGVIVELLQRWHFKEIRVLDVVVQLNHLYMDPFFKKEDVGRFATYEPLTEDICIKVSEMPESIDGFKYELRGVDLVIGFCDQKTVAVAARELGVPFISSGLITTFLPDGLRFEETSIPDPIILNPSLTSMMRSIQSFEAVKLLTGIGYPLFAPEAIKIDLLNYELKRVRVGRL